MNDATHIDEIITKIVQDAEIRGLSAFGIRSESKKMTIGTELDNSNQFGDTWDGDELGGTCAININYDGFDVENIDENINQLSQYINDGDSVILIGGTSSYEGTDCNETVIKNAQVLFIF